MKPTKKLNSMLEEMEKQLYEDAAAETVDPSTFAASPSALMRDVEDEVDAAERKFKNAFKSDRAIGIHEDVVENELSDLANKVKDAPKKVLKDVADLQSINRIWKSLSKSSDGRIANLIKQINKSSGIGNFGGEVAKIARDIGGGSSVAKDVRILLDHTLARNIQLLASLPKVSGLGKGEGIDVVGTFLKAADKLNLDPLPERLGLSAVKGKDDKKDDSDVSRATDGIKIIDKFLRERVGKEEATKAKESISQIVNNTLRKSSRRFLKKAS